MTPYVFVIPALRAARLQAAENRRAADSAQWNQARLSAKETFFLRAKAVGYARHQADPDKLLPTLDL